MITGMLKIRLVDYLVIYKKHIVLFFKHWNNKFSTFVFKFVFLFCHCMFDIWRLIFIILSSWRMACYTLCCWFHGYSSKKSCENWNDRGWAYGKALSIFFYWSVGMDWGSSYIVCFCIILPNITGDKCQNLPSVFACSHSVRIHGWFWVNILLFATVDTLWQ